MTALNKLAKVVRVLTVAPLMAAGLVTLLYGTQPARFGSLTDVLLALLFLTVLPLLGYPLQKFLPPYKHQGRAGQRSLAIVMAVVGYIAGLIHALAARVTAMQWTVYLTYLLSGVGIAVFNKLFKIHASGHACGVVGPTAIAVYYGGYGLLFGGCVLMLLVYWSSLRMHRHTVAQLLLGSAIPLIALAAAVGLTHIIV